MGVTLHTKVYARRGNEDMVFSSVNEATEFVKGRADRVYKCCKGVLKSHRGWRFSYSPFDPINQKVMTLKEFYEKIESFPSDTMNFCIEDVFSWRGIYSEPACSLSTCKTSKLHNLDMLHRLLNETFIGWKGGSYKYSFNHDINFELDEGMYTDGEYLINFIANNPSPEVKHIFG